ncbi:hypothetical protein BKA56DRAFT_622941 [Ilyonectria sp. MPI-CAGE-AT-0026]|nr:hypothetical protein BKA56DRAFT_622941 [Ilyonectria sp. MPI-CAGE-AT-0026]
MAGSTESSQNENPFRAPIIVGRRCENRQYGGAKEKAAAIHVQKYRNPPALLTIYVSIFVGFSVPRFKRPALEPPKRCNKQPVSHRGPEGSLSSPIETDCPAPHSSQLMLRRISAEPPPLPAQRDAEIDRHRQEARNTVCEIKQCSAPMNAGVMHCHTMISRTKRYRYSSRHNNALGWS